MLRRHRTLQRDRGTSRPKKIRTEIVTFLPADPIVLMAGKICSQTAFLRRFTSISG